MLNRIGLAAAVTVSSCALQGWASSEAKRPNIIFILADDLRWDAMSSMGHPFLKTPAMDRMRAEGVTFQNAFVTTALCSPSRASILTGAYAHNHRVTGNEKSEIDHDAMPTFPRLLKESGYETAFVGKWHMRRGDHPRPGFDYWLSFRGQGVYTDPVLNENGNVVKATGYTTDILTDYAINFINKERESPYCLYLSHKAVHSPFTPAPRDAGVYAGRPLPEPANARDTYAGKPKWTRSRFVEDGANGDVPDAVEPPEWDPAHARRMGYLHTINALDHGLGRILDALKARGELDNTVIIFTSDNGYFLGEHGLGDKRVMYEESIRVPLLMRYPPLAKPGSAVDQMVLNIDLAPTILDLAGVPAATTMQGTTVLPLLAGHADGWRSSFLYEYWVDLTPWIPRMVGVRTEKWKLVRYPDIDDIDELYDLESDRLEMHNLAIAPEYAQQRQSLEAELMRLLTETGWENGAQRNASLPNRGGE
jgi:arylsulfatase A-like enzyme